MKNNTILAILMLFTQFFSAINVSTYNIATPWEDAQWLAGYYTTRVCVNSTSNQSFSPTTTYPVPRGSFIVPPANYNIDIAPPNRVICYNEPYVYYKRCTDDDGDSYPCPECRYTLRTITASGVGYRSGAWDIERYSSALDGMELENIIRNIEINMSNVSTPGRLSNITLDFSGDRASVRVKLRSAYISYKTAQAQYQGCKNSDTRGPHQELATTAAPSTEGVCLLMGYEDILTFYPPNGKSVPGSPCHVRRPAHPNDSACENYPTNWKNAAGNALSALAESFSSADTNVAALKNIYRTLNFSGVCDRDYLESPGAKCEDIRSAITIIDSGAEESTYGQLAIAKRKKDELQLEVFCFPPTLTKYPEIMKLLWEDRRGFNPLVVGLTSEGNTTFARANAIYSNYKSQAENYSARVGAKKTELDNHQLSRITEALGSRGLNETAIGTIAQRYSDFSAKKSEADSLLANAATTYNARNQGYIKNATNRVKEAIGIYSGMESEGNAIISDAGRIVQERRQEAEALVQQAAALYQRTQNQKVGNYYQRALQELNSGNSATALGEKYSRYIAAAEYARTALSYGNVLENETLPLAEQLEDLINRAEIDEINVESEKAILNNMKTNEEYDKTTLRRAIESIIRKANLKYGDLIDIRKELLTNITESGNCGADLTGDLNNADRGLITNSGIDYINAIGRLKAIRAEYERIAEEVSVCAHRILLSNLLITKSSRVSEDIKIDAPSHVDIILIITNTGQKSGTDIDVPIDIGIDVQLLLSDIKNGRDNVNAVRTENGTTIFTIKEIKPLRTFSLTIEKNAVLAKTVSDQKNGVGREDGSVIVTEERIIELYAPGRLALPPGSSATVDGRAPLALEKGRHTVRMEYTIKDGYKKREEVETTKLGTNVQVEKKIKITPKVNIDSLPLTVQIDYPEITGLSVSARGATIKNNQCASPPCMLELANLKADEEAIVLIDFVVVNAPEAIQTIAPSLPSTDNCLGSGKKCGALPDELRALPSQINAAIAANDTATAIRLKERFDAEISEWNREQETAYNELVELKAKMQAEAGELDAILATAKGNNTLVFALQQRRAALQNSLRAAESADSIIDELGVLKTAESKGTNEIVGEYVTNAWKEYNALKTRLANTGTTTTPQEFIDVENKLSALEFNNDPKTAIELSEALGAAEAFVDQKEREMAAELETATSEFLSVKEGIEKLAESYKEQMNEAKGTEWESLFELDLAKTERLIEDVQRYFDDKNLKMAKMKLEQLKGKGNKIREALGELKEEAENQFLIVRGAYEEKKNSIPGDARTTLENELSAMLKYITDGKYIQAMKKGKALISQLASFKPESINPLLAIIALAAVGAAVGVYYMKRKGSGFGEGTGEITLPFLTKKKKEFRPLPKAEQKGF
ncbi:MAG: hypothetical protein QXT45_01195 [Candidatus Bilamarchaeaceae archaeon]